MARQQFTQQITVTAFDVHTVKADLPCQQRALYIPLRERVEVHVCDHNFPAFIQKRVMLRNQRTGNVSFRAAVTARMGQLQDIHRLVLRTILLRRRSVGLLQKRRKLAAVGRREHHLQFVGAPLRHHGAGFPPKQARAARRKTQIAPLNKLAWRAVGIGIAAFHRQDGHGIGRGASAYLSGLEQRAQIIPEREAGPKFLRFGLYRFQRFKIKFFMCCHIVWLAPFTIGRGRYSPAFVLKNACR